MKKKKFNIDKILIVLCLSCFIIVVVAQIGLKIPNAKGVFTNVEVFEGTAVNSQSDIITTGTLTLKMVNGTPKNEYEILVNGEKVDVFDLQTKKIELLSSSVVEIRAIDNDKAVVKIEDMTSNLSLVTANENVNIKKGINMIGRIILKTN